MPSSEGARNTSIGSTNTESTNTGNTSTESTSTESTSTRNTSIGNTSIAEQSPDIHHLTASAIKPEAEAKTQKCPPISVKVKNQITNTKVVFLINKKTGLSKLMNAYAQSQGVDPGTLRFFLDDVRIKEVDTPRTLGMEDNDQIDVYLESRGGSLMLPK
ncbi:uncharacterized protein BP5553_06724 [Venustampulla echinocandica]|uniref:Ubiquitin-like domain-containing protein n=1 Tax=Venustampulla echinocandica TaxID=2656787 RepID=A0A370TKQ9_9HELO|nr:uncharacterized protein BP5553_06724 [Venustampulla echinocandica]RDL36112.1 hypothetical protein BP5553_06724 [Venustampulla echinocandica]